MGYFRRPQDRMRTSFQILIQQVSINNSAIIKTDVQDGAKFDASYLQNGI
jgi:hypothetical protein